MDPLVVGRPGSVEKLMPIPRTVMEPEDIFVKEFYRHPAWSGVIRHLEAMAMEHKLAAAEATPETLPRLQGRFEGYYEAIAAIRTLLNQGG